MDKKFLNLKLEYNDSDSSNYKTIEIGKDSKYRLLSIEGIESSDYEINITNNAQYDGGYVDSKRIGARSISIIAEFPVIEEAESERQKLIAFFNPKKSGVLTVNYGGVERAIEYEIEGFKEKRTNLYEPLSFQINLICPDPYFKSINKSRTEVVTWKGGWNFKFKLPFKFKEREKSIGVIYNEGHIETPVEVVFRGPAINPAIKNVNTGEFIKIRYTLTEEDDLYVNTAYGNKKVEIIREGQINAENAFNYIDLDSTFFKLVPGENLIEYSSEDLELRSKGVEIIFKNKYLGV